MPASYCLTVRIGGVLLNIYTTVVALSLTEADSYFAAIPSTIAAASLLLVSLLLPSLDLSLIMVTANAE